MSVSFAKAERRRAHLKIALTGPSGSGKTFSALEIASGLGKKIAVGDTENGSASLYADRFEFDVVEISPPFTAQKYIDVVNAAVKGGYDVLIVDSFSHSWAGEGGVMDKKDALDARGGSKFANWKQPKREHQKLKDAILHSGIHIISTIRSKQGYLQVEDGGKSQVKKVGMDPIAEPGIEYEYTVVLDLDMSHHAQASKDRTGLFDGQLFIPNASTGEKLLAWLNGAKVATPPPPPPVTETKPAPTKSSGSRPTPKSQPAPASNQNAEDPGEYQLPKEWKQYKQAKLNTLTPEQLSGVIDWLEGRGEQITPGQSEVLFYARLYRTQLEMRATSVEEPPADEATPEATT